VLGVAVRILPVIVFFALCLQLPIALAAEPLTIWMMGDSNTGGLIYLSLTDPNNQLLHENWQVSNKLPPDGAPADPNTIWIADGATETADGLRITIAALASYPAPDVAFVAWGGMDVVNSCDPNSDGAPRAHCDQAVSNLLEIKRLLESEGTYVYLAEGVGANYRGPMPWLLDPSLEPIYREWGKCAHEGYRYIGKRLRGARPFLSYHTRYREENWYRAIHLSTFANERVAEKVARRIRSAESILRGTTGSP
jgi:hypothetical protein